MHVFIPSRRLSEARSFTRGEASPWRRSISRDSSTLPRGKSNLILLLIDLMKVYVVTLLLTLCWQEFVVVNSAYLYRKLLTHCFI